MAQRKHTVTWVQNVVYNAAGLPNSMVRLDYRGETPGEDEHVTESWWYNAR